MLESFGEDAWMWWDVFAYCVAGETDPQTKQTTYSIKWDAVTPVFDAKCIGDRDHALATLRMMIEEMNSLDMPEEWIFGWTDEDEDETD